MFTKSIDEAKKNRLESPSGCSIIMFLIRLKSGEQLPLFIVTDLCLLTIYEDIRSWRQSLLDYCVSENIDYGCLSCVGYVE